MLEGDQWELAEEMIRISGEGYCAGWMHNLEFDLWHAIMGSEREYGFITLSLDTLTKLKALSNKIGGWIRYKDGEGETFTPMAEWQSRYQAWAEARGHA